jgi:hypothetical protein
MDDKLLISKIVVLLYRESLLPNKTENSAELVRKLLQTIKVSETTTGLGINSEREIILKMKHTVLEMCGYSLDHSYDLPSLLQTIKHNSFGDEHFYQGLEVSLKQELSEEENQKTVLNIRKSIFGHLKKEKISEVVNKASLDFKFNFENIKSVDDWVRGLIAELEPLQVSQDKKDPAIDAEIHVADKSQINKIFDKVIKVNTGQKIFKTGWQGLNQMLQGGFRPGEAWWHAAIQHGYKTGSSLTLFRQLVTLNEPMRFVPNKKPAAISISFEDPVENNFQFLYQNMKFNETKQYVDIRNLSIETMSDVVHHELSKTGFEVFILKVNPSLWTYRDLLNKVMEYEADGYSVEILRVDYLSKLPTTGCVQGASGDDWLDMMGRVKSFCNSKGILFLSPHQLSTEAKALLRGGMPEDQFVKEIAGKGYFEKSKGMDRIYDGCLLMHKFRHQNKYYLSIYLDKHRLPTIVDDDLKYMLLPFPKGMPIPDDIFDEEPMHLRKLPKFSSSNQDDNLFNF